MDLGFVGPFFYEILSVPVKFGNYFTGEAGCLALCMVPDDLVSST